MVPLNMQKQQELFEEFVIKEKRKGRFFGAFKFKKPVFPQHSMIFSLSYETVIISLIAVILVASIIFSLGVERGRNLKFSAGSLERSEEVKSDLSISDQTSDLPTAIISEKTSKLELRPEIKQEKKEPEKDVSSKTAPKIFTIQVASYKKRDSAEAAAARLKKSGDASEIFKKGNFFIVCVGSYADKEAAQKKLSDLKPAYKDCYLRKR